MPRHFLIVAVCAYLLRVDGAVLVGPGGTGVVTFNQAPAVTEWSTRAVAGGSSSINDAAALDAAVQLLSAGDLTFALPTSRTVPPSANALGRWNEIMQLVQTKLDGIAYNAIMGTLQNRTGGDVAALRLRYELTSGTGIAEQVPGYRVYISLSGEINSWQVVPGLSTGVPGPLSDTFIFDGLWPSNSLLHVLFVDDNALGDDSYHTIDNFAAWPLLADEAVTSMGALGTGTNQFMFPEDSSAWRMRSYYEFFGSHTNITNAAMLDARVQQETALEWFAPLGMTATTPPDPGARADYHTVWQCLVVCPTGNDYTALASTLRNDSGSEQFALTVSYDATDGVTNGMEQVPRLRGYYSLTGLPGQWQVIPEFCNATGRLSARLELGRWPPGSHLFLLWADDNGPYAGNNFPGSIREGVNTIDNFVALPAMEPRLDLLGRDATSVTLGWTVIAAGYEPRSQAEVSGTNWQPVAINLATSNDQRRVRITTTNSAAGYYRLVKE